MSRSRRRRNRRIRYILLAIASLVILVVGTWYCLDALSAPNIVVRVLFSETASCTQRERILVAGVMRNRIGNPAFGNATTLKGVVEQPGAFSCVGDMPSIFPAGEKVGVVCKLVDKEDLEVALYSADGKTSLATLHKGIANGTVYVAFDGTDPANGKAFAPGDYRIRWTVTGDGYREFPITIQPKK